MARVAGHSPTRLEPPKAREMRDEDFMPPHLPYVLLCHASTARCGRTFTVNRIDQWREALKARRDHEAICPIPPLIPLFMPGDIA
jgi:hypothetical protein